MPIRHQSLQQLRPLAVIASPPVQQAQQNIAAADGASGQVVDALPSVVIHVDEVDHCWALEAVEHGLYSISDPPAGLYTAINHYKDVIAVLWSCN